MNKTRFPSAVHREDISWQWNSSELAD